jgi:hypothetical protein
MPSLSYHHQQGYTRDLIQGIIQASIHALIRALMATNFADEPIQSY